MKGAPSITGTLKHLAPITTFIINAFKTPQGHTTSLFGQSDHTVPSHKKEGKGYNFDDCPVLKGELYFPFEI